jgi:hypothetical protein
MDVFLHQAVIVIDICNADLFLTAIRGDQLA